MEWRVWRQQIAWRPRYRGFFLDTSGDSEGIGLMINLALNVIPFTLFALSLTSSLLATVVVWPWRRWVSRRWTVHARPPSGTEFPDREQVVHGRAAADALVREWAAAIKREGTLVSP